jgi:ribonuclease P protein component
MVLPREHRLRGRFVVGRHYPKGRRFHGSLLVLRTMAAEPALLKPGLHPPGAPGGQPPRFAVVVSSKVSKKSVRRNQLRRLLHGQLVTLARAAWSGADQWVLISLKPGSADADDGALLGECAQLLQKAGLSQ